MSNTQRATATSMGVIRDQSGFTLTLKPSGILQSKTLDCNYLSVVPAIHWDHEVSLTILEFLHRAKGRFRDIADFDLAEPLRSQMRSVVLALDAYYDSERPIMTRGTLIKILAEKDSALTLKRIRIKSYIQSIGASLFETEDWWESVISYHIYDIGDIFNYSYAFNFVEECDDYLSGMIPLKQKNDIVSKFRYTLRGILRDIEDIEELDSSEYNFYESSSVSLASDGKTMPNWLMKESEKYGLSKSINMTKRCLAYVSPNNVRDTVILEPKSRNRVRLIDKQTTILLQQVKGSSIHLSDFEIYKSQKKMIKNYPYVICRDIKKEGITKPRNLLKIMLEELHERFPTFKAYDCPSFYENFSILVDKDEIVPLRGHGLGMANSLTTLMQCVIAVMIRNSVDVEGLVSPEFSFMAYNDDYTAFFKSEEDLEIYWDIEGSILDGLSIIRAPNKSFRAHGSSVLCEEYYDSKKSYLNRKESYLRCEALIPFKGRNIAHAKELCNSIGPNRYVAGYLTEIVSFWGYEFYENEYKSPAIFGGWLTPRLCGVDMSLTYLQHINNRNAYNALRAHCIKPKYLGKVKKSSYSPPIFQLYPNIQIPEEFKDYFDDVSIWRMLYKRYQRRANPVLCNRTWDYLLETRRKIFRENLPSIEIESLIELCRDELNRDFYPIPCMIKSYARGELYKGPRIREVYSMGHSRDDLISHLGFIRPFSIPNRFTYLNVKDEILDIELTVKNLISDSSQNRILRSTFNEWDSTSMIYSNDREVLESYLAPFKMSAAAGIYEGYHAVPILKEQFRHPYIQDKISIYGRIFNLDDRIFLHRQKVNDRDTIKKFQLMFSYSESEIDDALRSLNLIEKEEEDKVITVPVENVSMFDLDKYYEFESNAIEPKNDNIHAVWSRVRDIRLREMMIAISKDFLKEQDRSMARGIDMEDAISRVLIRRLADHESEIRESAYDAVGLFGDDDEVAGCDY